MLLQNLQRKLFRMPSVFVGSFVDSRIEIVHLIITRTQKILTGAVHPCVMDLQKYRAAFFMHRTDDLFQPVNLSVLPDAQLVLREFSLRVNTGGFLNDQAGTAPGNGSVMFNIFVHHAAVFLHPVIAYHRRHTDTILYF